jgi:hypothetical protein
MISASVRHFLGSTTLAILTWILDLSITPERSLLVSAVVRDQQGIRNCVCHFDLRKQLLCPFSCD